MESYEGQVERYQVQSPFRAALWHERNPCRYTKDKDSAAHWASHRLTYYFCIVPRIPNIHIFTSTQIDDKNVGLSIKTRTLHCIDN